MIGIYLLSVALGWIIMNYLSNTDDGTTYLGNSEFAIYATQQILEMSSIKICLFQWKKERMDSINESLQPKTLINSL